MAIIIDPVNPHMVIVINPIHCWATSHKCFNRMWTLVSLLTYHVSSMSLGGRWGIATVIWSTFSMRHTFNPEKEWYVRWDHPGKSKFTQCDVREPLVKHCAPNQQASTCYEGTYLEIVAALWLCRPLWSGIMGEENHQYMHVQFLAKEWRGVKLQNGNQEVKYARVKIAALEYHIRQAWGVPTGSTCIYHVYCFCAAGLV